MTVVFVFLSDEAYEGVDGEADLDLNGEPKNSKRRKLAPAPKPATAVRRSTRQQALASSAGAVQARDG